MRIRRINFVAGPGTGKSCTAAWVFAQLKFKHVNCELAMEKVKSWAYEGRAVRGFDQHYLFGKQMKAEDTFLHNGVELVISDSPLYLCAAYGRKFECPSWETLLIESKEFDRAYPSFNIFMERSPDQPYQPLGRFQTQAEALAMDEQIYSVLDAYGVKMHRLRCYNNLPAVLALIEKILEAS